MYKRKHLSSMFLALLVFAVMWILYGWNYWNGDREGYEAYYYSRDTLASWGGEVGYGFLNIFASGTGLPYQAFQVLISLVTLLLVLRYILKTTISPFASILVYAVFFFSLDFVLMRNFLAFAIFLQGILVLYEGKQLCKIKYALIILLAATIHQSSLMFMVFIFIPINRTIDIGRFIILFFVFLCFYVLARYSLPLPDSIARHFNYYDTSLKSSLANVFMHLVSTVLITLVVLAERKSLYKLDNFSARDRELSFVLSLNLLSLFFLVLYFESEIFIRLFRSVLFFNMLHCINSFFLLRRTYLFLVLYILFFAIYLIFFFLVPVAGFSVFPLFNYNLLLN
ncbi:EpsG family protein [Pseudomonas sp. NFX15]|uniref:EpsG family protein n=1 Tax=Pseudomonas sp. NFX15 TaxID=2816958 RepID=UPI003B8D11B8